MAQAAIAEFRVLAAEMERFQRDPNSTGLATARLHASRFNQALAAVPKPEAQVEALPRRSQHAYSKDWQDLTEQHRQAAMQLGALRILQAWYCGPVL
jgi:hypothetical protein